MERKGGRIWLPTDMTHDMLMMQEETFGPFLPIMTFKNDDEAVALANDSRYGLAASVWTRNIKAGYQLARRLRAGHVMINNAVQSGGCATLPFGGERDSGVARLSGEQAFFNWVAPKSLMQSPKSSKYLWMPYHSGAGKMAVSLTRGLYGRTLGERISGIFGFLKYKG